MPKLKSRMMFDVVLTIMLIFEMFYQLTGNFLHEFVGALFFVCIIVHLLFSSRWIKDTAKSIGKLSMNRKRKGLAIVATLLFVDVLALATSSVIISNTLWSAGIDLSALNPNGIWYPIHTASAYGLSMLVLCHLAMHWVSMAHVMKIEYNPARRKAIGQCVNVAVGLGAIALGVAGAKQVGQALPIDTFNQDDAPASSATPTTSSSTDTQPMSMRDAAGQNADAGTTPQPAQEPQTRNGKPNKSGKRDRRTDSTSDTIDERDKTASASDNASREQFEEPVEYYDEEPVYDEPSANEQQAGTSANQNLGTCSLCPKHCSLSSPRCNKPYEAGLI